MLQSSAPRAFIVLHEFSLLPSRLFFSDSLYPSLPPSIFLCPLDPFLISALVLWQILPSSYSLKFGSLVFYSSPCFFTFVQREHSASRGSCLPEDCKDTFVSQDIAFLRIICFCLFWGKWAILELLGRWDKWHDCSAKLS